MLISSMIIISCKSDLSVAMDLFEVPAGNIGLTISKLGEYILLMRIFTNFELLKALDAAKAQISKELVITFNFPGALGVLINGFVVKYNFSSSSAEISFENEKCASSVDRGNTDGTVNKFNIVFNLISGKDGL